MLRSVRRAICVKIGAYYLCYCAWYALHVTLRLVRCDLTIAQCVMPLAAGKVCLLSFARYVKLCVLCNMRDEKFVYALSCVLSVAYVSLLLAKCACFVVPDLLLAIVSFGVVLSLRLV